MNRSISIAGFIIDLTIPPILCKTHDRGYRRAGVNIEIKITNKETANPSIMISLSFFNGQRLKITKIIAIK
tara:strand:- start:729 stop:941 length:213 start_codon:yes stop_codon:yes gene_type:complete